MPSLLQEALDHLQMDTEPEPKHAERRHSRCAGKYSECLAR
jgi:hypothetical protein